MSIEIVNEPIPPVHPSGKPRLIGHMKLVYVEEETQKVIKETVTDGWQENERRTRDDAHILDVGHQSGSPSKDLQEDVERFRSRNERCDGKGDSR